MAKFIEMQFRQIAFCQGEYFIRLTESMLGENCCSVVSNDAPL